MRQGPHRRLTLGVPLRRRWAAVRATGETTGLLAAEGLGRAGGATVGYRKAKHASATFQTNRKKRRCSAKTSMSGQRVSLDSSLRTSELEDIINSVSLPNHREH